MDTSPAPKGTTYGVPARRKQIADRLSDAYSRDMLDQREFESRLERAEAAGTIEELDALVADFGQPQATVPTSPAGERSFAVIGDQSHVLVPGGPESFRAFTVLGDVKVDLRAFRGSGRTLTVEVSGVVGDAKVLVPHGAIVVRRARTVLGDTHLRLAKEPGVAKKFFAQVFGRSDVPPASPFPDQGPPPTVVLTGWRLLGDVVIEEDR